jgi:hypothetical protein
MVMNQVPAVTHRKVTVHSSSRKTATSAAQSEAAENASAASSRRAAEGVTMRFLKAKQ